MRSSHLTDGVILLRPPTDDDVDAITDACQDPQIAAWIPIPQPYAREHAEHFIAHLARPGWESGVELTWAIVDRATGLLLGMIGMHRIEYGSGEIGFWMAPTARRRGVLSRALQLVLDYAFDADGLDLVRVGWQAIVGNWPSRRVAWRAGFRLEGTVRLNLVHRDGIRRDAWVATLLRDDPREPCEPWPDDAPTWAPDVGARA